MPIGYAIVSLRVRSDRERALRVWQVVWDSAEAAEIVERLNARASNAPEPYSFHEVWVPPHDGRVRLTPTDRELLDLAALHGVKNTERPMAVFFSFIFNRAGGKAAVDELRALGWPEPGMTDEGTGGDLFHVYAHGWRGVLSEAGITELRRQMEAIAERHGGTFDGWEVGGGGDLRHAKPGEIPD